MFNPESSLVAWSDPPPTLMLAANEVHVWRASLNCEPSVFSRLESSLSPDERAPVRFHRRIATILSECLCALRIPRADRPSHGTIRNVKKTRRL